MRKNSRKLLDKVPQHAKAVIVRKNIGTNSIKTKKHSSRKYTQPKDLTIYQGYDLLENMVLVRMFIQKKYKISLATLEVLLYLFPKNYFMHKDYFEMPKPMGFNRIKNLTDLNMIDIAVNGVTMVKSVFRLSTRARNIVIDFYQYLSGEKKIPEGGYQESPFHSEKPNMMTKMRMDLVTKLNNLEPSESKKSLFM